MFYRYSKSGAKKENKTYKPIKLRHNFKISLFNNSKLTALSITLSRGWPKLYFSTIMGVAKE
jgi:hypothetical protein